MIFRRKKKRVKRWERKLYRGKEWWWGWGVNNIESEEMEIKQEDQDWQETRLSMWVYMKKKWRMTNSKIYYLLRLKFMIFSSLIWCPTFSLLSDVILVTQHLCTWLNIVIVQLLILLNLHPMVIFSFSLRRRKINNFLDLLLWKRRIMDVSYAQFTSYIEATTV